jgi:hypothetical protein
MDCYNAFFIRSIVEFTKSNMASFANNFGELFSPDVWTTNPPNYTAIQLVLTWLWIALGGLAQLTVINVYVWKQDFLPTPWKVNSMIRLKLNG